MYRFIIFVIILFSINVILKSQELDSAQIHLQEDSLIHQSRLDLLTEPLEKNETSNFWEKEKWGMSVASIVAIGATIYLQSESDKYFEKYENATTTEDAISFKSKSKKLTEMYNVSVTISIISVVSSAFGWTMDE